MLDKTLLNKSKFDKSLAFNSNTSPRNWGFVDVVRKATRPRRPLMFLSAPVMHYKVVHNEVLITFHGLLIIFTDARNLVVTL